jgi:poly(3-hydroxybutyrate) depolymerase
LNIDTNRIYATGHSNGGGFVNLLACTASVAPMFAAFATSSAALYAGTHSMSGCNSGGHAVAMIDFHGIADGQIPYIGRADRDGNTAYALPHIDDWRQQWAQRAGCAAPPAGVRMSASVVTKNYNGTLTISVVNIWRLTPNPSGFNATSYRWNCPKATVIGYTVQTMGHFWLTKAGGYWDETPVNIVNFFNSRPQGQPTGA